MAYCPHCELDRPIKRQTFDGSCLHCGEEGKHLDECRGPVKDALDVCSHCNTTLFSLARSRSEYFKLERLEQEAQILSFKMDQEAQSRSRLKAEEEARASTKTVKKAGIITILASLFVFPFQVVIGALVLIIGFLLLAITVDPKKD